MCVPKTIESSGKLVIELQQSTNLARFIAEIALSPIIEPIMALALYRKYRPRRLEDVLGQETTVEILKNAAREDRIGHGYLFYGPRGTGKTTTARLIAKLLNCEKRSADKKFHAQSEPCNECRTCKEIYEGISLDLIEIDAASNRGIDEIRTLKESTKIGPTSGSYKIYIIDEAHMLTKDAMNALLKTLEEPPSHVVLVLATTEYEKLPATVTSRTQRFLFKKLSKSIIIKKLKEVARHEAITIDESALERIAATAEGSLRDAESLLDQLRSLTKNIDAKIVESLTGRVGIAEVHGALEVIMNGTVEESLVCLTRLNDEGHNVIQFTRDLIHYLRKIIVLRYAPTLHSHMLQEFTPDEFAQMQKLASEANLERITLLLKLLLRAYVEMPYSPFAPISLELAVEEYFAKGEELSK